MGNLSVHVWTFFLGTSYDFRENLHLRLFFREYIVLEPAFSSSAISTPVFCNVSGALASRFGNYFLVTSFSPKTEYEKLRDYGGVCAARTSD